MLLKEFKFNQRWLTSLDRARGDATWSSGTEKQWHGRSDGRDRWHQQILIFENVCKLCTTQMQQQSGGSYIGPYHQVRKDSMKAKRRLTSGQEHSALNFNSIQGSKQIKQRHNQRLYQIFGSILSRNSSLIQMSIEGDEQIMSKFSRELQGQEKHHPVMYILVYLL